MPEKDSPDEIVSMMAEAAKVDALFQRYGPWVVQRSLDLAPLPAAETREAAE